MVRKIYMASLVAMLLLVPLVAQDKDTSLSLENVNGWSLGFVGVNPPFNVFDTTLTGTRIEPTDIPGDSAQLFQMYGNSEYFYGEWMQGFDWDKDISPEIPVPEKLLFDLKIKGSVSVQIFGLAIGIIDTSVGISILPQKITLKPDWQTIEKSTFNEDGWLKEIHKVRLSFFLYTPDSSYCGIEILLNNLRGVTGDDTVLIDPFQYGSITAIESPWEEPKEFMLHQNYPNPFNPSTTIEYTLKEGKRLTLDVYDILGRHVERLIDGFQASGTHQIVFHADKLASGTYIYVLRSKGYSLQRKMLLVK